MSNTGSSRQSVRRQEIQKVAGYERMFAICVDDDRSVFKLKLYHNPANFPLVHVDDGTLEQVESRLNWRQNQRIKYYYENGDDNGDVILEADILEICTGGTEAADIAVLRHSEYFAEQSMLGKKSVRSNTSILNGSLDFEFDDRQQTPSAGTPVGSINRMVGKSPVSVSTSAAPAEKMRSSENDPDYLPEGYENRNCPSKQSRQLEAASSVADRNLDQLTIQDVLRSIQTLTSTVHDYFGKTDKTLKVLLERVRRIENSLKTGQLSELRDMKTLNEGNCNFIVNYIMDSKIPLIWMSIDMKERFETFLMANATLDARALTKKLAVRMWGDRMIRYNKISLHDRKSKQPNARPSLKQKDPQGFAIFKTTIVMWDTAATVAMTRDESLANKANDDEVKSAVDKMEKVLNATSEKRAESLLKVANGYGLDTDDRIERVKLSWYWDLIDQRCAPSPSWTIWDELVTKENADLKQDRSRGLKEDDDEQSETLKRIREFQLKVANGEEIDHNLYDRFGVKL